MPCGGGEEAGELSSESGGVGREGRGGTGAKGRLERGEPASDIPGEPPGCRVAPYYHTMARRLFVFGCPDKGLINGCHDSSEAASRYGEARFTKLSAPARTQMARLATCLRLSALTV